MNTLRTVEKRDWAKSLENRRKHYKILKQDFIVLFSLIN